MSFLPHVSQKRRTCTLPDFREETPTCTFESESICSSNNNNNSNGAYDYISTPKRNRTSLDKQNTEIRNKLDSLLQAQTKLIQAREVAASEAPFQNALKGIDYFLQQWPKEIADAACVEFTKVLCQKVAIHKLNNS
ncbi:uncharacterized protein LOC118750184 [Rhagoletis pomonella]|uniref:uncharacterized protein LOC118750184 n=1 Tax=Rhagoletis pomonella TaxID=28610 RepID=UPI001785BAF1|nr:uncharacterized protein LOC118750184 [Rhagoletis pomonella]